MKLIMEKMQIHAVQICWDNSEINQTERDKINDSIEGEDNVPEKKHKCDVCEYECEKEITWMKHNNTKHMNVNHKENNGDGQKTTKKVYSTILQRVWLFLLN